MIDSNLLKEKLLKGLPVIGTWNTISSPILTNIISESGLDFQIIDLEHGPFILDKINLHINACEGSLCTPLVRIPDNSEWMALQALDQGAKGLVVPHISSKKDALKFIESVKYFPKGGRGFTPFSKAAGFNNKNTSSYIKTSNTEILSIAIIESLEGIEMLEEIISIDGIDVIYFGSYDLSQSLGYPGDIKNPKVIQKIKRAVEIVNKNGKVAGGFVPQTKNDVDWLLDLGIRFITYDVDSSIIYNHYKDVRNWFDEKLIR